MLIRKQDKVINLDVYAFIALCIMALCWTIVISIMIPFEIFLLWFIFTITLNFIYKKVKEKRTKLIINFLIILSIVFFSLTGLCNFLKMHLIILKMHLM